MKPPVTLKQRAHDFIVNNRTAALATTADDGMPHVAIVYCLVDDDLDLYFSTRVESRKYKNLLNKPIASMAFYNEKSLATIQLTGTAARVDDLQTEQEILYKLLTLRHKEPNRTIPPVKLFERGATNELAIMKVVPTEMTYASFETKDGGRYNSFFQQIV